MKRESAPYTLIFIASGNKKTATEGGYFCAKMKPKAIFLYL